MCVGNEKMKKRTPAFGLRIIALYSSLPGYGAAQIIGRQLALSGTSVDANYRASFRARSRADFIAKLKIAEDEWDESIYWLEILSNIRPNDSSLIDLIGEAEEPLSVIVASIKTAREPRAS